MTYTKRLMRLAGKDEDTNQVAADIKSREGREQTAALVRILEPGQRDILEGNYRDLTEFLSELDAEDME